MMLKELKLTLMHTTQDNSYQIVRPCGWWRGRKSWVERLRV